MADLEDFFWDMTHTRAVVDTTGKFRCQNRDFLNLFRLNKRKRIEDRRSARTSTRPRVGMVTA